MSNIVIIGNGISGVTAARNIRKRDSESSITIISAETDYFFSRTALMYIYMGHMRFKDTQPYEPYFWKKNRIDLKRAYVSSIEYNSKTLNFDSGESMHYDKLILAVGSKPTMYNWPGQNLPGVQGLYSYQDLELIEKNSVNAKRAVIVGGGLIGIELAEMMLSRGIKVTFLVRDNLFWGNVLPKQEAELITRHIIKHHVDLRLGEELEEVFAGEDARVSKVKLKNSGELLDCDIVGLTTGVQPNINFLKDSVLEVDKGILVNQLLETNQQDVYAIGDCAQFTEPVNGRRPIEQVWYTGRIMGEAVAKTITGEKTKYKPGHWFNSAKFFDIEYQTYGWVFSNLRDGENDFYWEEKGGEIAMHFVFEIETRKFVGVNTFGIRLRHEMFDKWLNEANTIDYVIEHLKDANFDPEFYKQFENEIVNSFNESEGTSIKAKNKSWRRILNLA